MKSKRIILKIKAAGRILQNALRNMPWRWVFFGISLYIAIVAARFPYDTMIGKAIHTWANDKGINLSFRDIHHQWPFVLRFKSLSYIASNGLHLAFYDPELDLDVFALWKDRLKITIQSSGWRLSHGEIFVRASIDITADIQNYNKAVSLMSGNIHITIKNMDFGDLRKLLSKSEKTRMVASMLGEKIPAKLIFQKIHIETKIADRELKIQKAEVQGKEIHARIEGKVSLRDNLASSRLNNRIIIKADSPIWSQLGDELSLLQSMHIIDDSGDLVIPISGYLNNPLVQIHFSPR